MENDREKERKELIEKMSSEMLENKLTPEIQDLYIPKECIDLLKNIINHKMKELKIIESKDTISIDEIDLSKHLLFAFDEYCVYQVLKNKDTRNYVFIDHEFSQLITGGRSTISQLIGSNPDMTYKVFTKPKL